ncbi:hypothetical protein C8R43DRAFT_1139958 [Mycena crocata]|nr:hypothetical protein C8R43DRAFT_1139958 [Mycena crocata]
MASSLLTLAQSFLYSCMSLASLFIGIIATNIPRKSPTLTLVSGVESTTSTVAAGQAAYQKALQECGPDIDDALQSSLQRYNEAERGNGLPNIPNVDDRGFRHWKDSEDPVYQLAARVCMNAKNELAEERHSVTASSDSSTVDTGPSSASPRSGATTTSGPSGTDASSTPLPGGGIIHRSKPMVLFAGISGLLARLA